MRNSLEVAGTQRAELSEVASAAPASDAELAALIREQPAVGLALVSPLLAVVLRLLPRDVPLLKTPAIDWRVGWFVAAVMCVAIGTRFVSSGQDRSIAA